MLFEPSANECTSFENVRVLKFGVGAVEINVLEPISGKKMYKNTKPLKIYFNTNSLEIMNTLQVVHFASEKTKLKCDLKELMEQSDIGKQLKKWATGSTV